MSTLPKNPIICVDFDGVCHSYTSGWQGADVILDPPVDGAIDWIMAHLPVPDELGMAPEYVGPEVQIYSARSGQSGGIKAMREWFIRHGLPKPYITDDVLKFPTTKPPAFLTLDDRAICFTGRFPTSDEMLGFVSWQKKGVDGRPAGSNVSNWPHPSSCACQWCRESRAAAKLLGATGQFPDGKMSVEDEGELQLAVGHDQDTVQIHFGKQVSWLGLDRATAINFARTVMRHAVELRE